MSDGPAWFAPKRYGFGSGLPISWQGWLLTIGFMVAAIAVGSSFGDRPLVAVAILAPLTIAFLVIAVRTTKGGWRWRWGEKD
jgi:hypothetical protein